MSSVIVDDLKDGTTVLQIGVAPNRADILQRISGVDFDEAWNERDFAVIGASLEVPVISLRLLLINKQTAGRERDVLDVKKLKEWNMPSTSG